MAICRFCQGRFQSEQAVKAHMKWCDEYEIKKSPKVAALGTQPKAAPRPTAVLPAQSIPHDAAPDLCASLRELEKAMSEFTTERQAPQASQQRRRKMIQAAKTEVIDYYHAPLGHVTPSMRGDAKAAIERELSTVPLEELPIEEVIELAAAIRDRVYAAEFTRQAREAERRDAKKEKVRRAELEQLGKLRRADLRKKVFIEQASNQACAHCQEKGIIGRMHLGVMVDIESRLEALLTGGEPILECQAIVRAVLEARFAEAAATLAAAQAKADAKWREDMIGLLLLAGALALPVLASKYPNQVIAVINWIECTFGLKPAAQSEAPTPNESEDVPPATRAESRPRTGRRLKTPATPFSAAPRWGNSVEVEPGHV